MLPLDMCLFGWKSPGDCGTILDLRANVKKFIVKAALNTLSDGFEGSSKRSNFSSKAGDIGNFCLGGRANWRCRPRKRRATPESSLSKQQGK